MAEVRRTQIFDISEPLDIARFVIEVLAGHEGWQKLESTDVEVAELSEEKVWKVIPPIEEYAVVLHDASNIIDPLSRRRLLAAGSIFAKHGLAPCRLASGQNWYVEEFLIGKECTVNTLEDCRELGRFTAAFHDIPVDWFDEIRDELVERNPVLDKVVRGSSIWSYVMCNGFYSKGPLPSDDELCVQYASMVRPASSVASRLVTSHGDYYPPNIVRLENGKLMCIDLDFTCCNFAVEDLGIIWHMPSAEHKHAFIEAYLEAMGESADLADAVILDAELDGLSRWDFGSRVSCFVKENRSSEDLREAIEFCNNVASEIRSCEELTNMLLAEGVEAVIPRTKTFQQLPPGKFFASATSAAEIRRQSGNKMPWNDCIEKALLFEHERAKL